MIGNAPSPAGPSLAEAVTPSGAPAGARPLRARLGTVLLPLLAILTALLLCAVVLAITGHDPRTVYGALWSGAVSGSTSFSDTLVAGTPYLLLGLAIALGFKGGLFNIGAEGQFIVGAIAATAAGHNVGGPGLVQIVVTLLAGAAGGALYAAIAGVLKVISGAHEVITTIMLNYIAVYLVQFLVDNGGLMHDAASQSQQSYYLAPGAQLPALAQITIGGAQLTIGWGLVVALLGAVAVYVLVWRTTWGFELRAVGLNPQAARSAGISVRRVTVWVMAVSGALAGLAGAVQVSGLLHLLPDPFDNPAAGLGFDAIAVAIIGAGNPAGIALAALLFGGLRNGATTMEATAGISGPFVSVIEAVIFLFVAAPTIIRFIYYRRVRPRAAPVAAARPKTDAGAGPGTPTATGLGPDS